VVNFPEKYLFLSFSGTSTLNILEAGGFFKKVYRDT